MSMTPIFDQLAAEFFAERKVRVESLFVKTPGLPPFHPPVVEPVQKVIPKPGAVCKAVKPFFRIEDVMPTDWVYDVTNESWISSNEPEGENPLTLQDRAEKLSDGSRLAYFAEIRDLFDKPAKTPYRTEKMDYVGEDTQEIDVTFLRTTKTLQHLE